jgi:murein DD-endopeptidase MepM/ murein hydrolase activator NlpD
MSYRQVIDVLINGTSKIDNLVNQFAAAERAAAGLSESIESINQRLTDSPAATNRAMQGYERASRRWVAIMKARKRSSRAEDSPLITNEQRQASREAGAAATREASRDLSAARQRLRNAKIRERLLVAEVRRNKERQAAVDTARERLESSMEETMGNLTGAGLQSRRARTTTMAQRRTTRATRLDQRGLPSDIALKPGSRLGQRSNQISDRVAGINDFLDRLDELRTRVERSGGKNTNRNLQRIENLRSNLTAELGSLAEGLAEIQRITRGRRSTFNTARVFADKADTLFQIGEIDEKKRKKIIKGNENAIALANEDNVDAAKTVLQSTKNTLDAEARRIANAKAIKAYQDRQYKALIAGENTSLENQKERTREMFKYQDLMADTDRKIRSGKTLNSKELQAWMGDRTVKALPPVAGYPLGQPLPREAMLPTSGARLIGQSREFLTNAAGRRTYIPELERLSIARMLPSTKPAATEKQASTERLLKNLKSGVRVSVSEAERLTGGMYKALPDEKILNAAGRGIKQLTTNQQEFNQSVESGTRFQQKFREEQERLAKIYGTATPAGTMAPGGRSAGRKGASVKEVESLTSILGGLSGADASAKVFRGGRSPEAAIGKIALSFNSATGQAVGGNSAQPGLRDLGKLSRATNTQLELLQKALSETRDGMRTTDRQFRELTKTIAKVEDQQARRDPNADFLTKRFGSRGADAISEGLIGGAFPLLFGQGLGASAGGLIGGAVGGAAGGMLGFGLSLVGTAVGSAVDTTVQNLKDLAAGLRSPARALDALEASGLASSRSLEGTRLYVDQLTAVGRAYDAQTLVLQEVQKRLGPGSLTELNQLDIAQERLQEQWGAIVSQMQGELLPVLQDFVDFLGGAANTIGNFASQNRLQRLDPETFNKLVGQAAKDTGSRTLFGGIDLAKQQQFNNRLSELSKQELSKRFANERAQIQQTPEEKLADETARIEQSRKIADQIKSAYRESLNLQRRAYDLQHDGAMLNRDMADYSYKKEREIFDLRQQAAEARINNNRAATQNRIESSDLDARKVFASATGFEQQLLTNVREAMRTRKEGEADIEQSRRKLELTLAKLNRDVEDYKRTTAREIEDIERRKLAYIRSVEDYKMQVADYVLDRAREAADLMRQAMTLPDMSGAGGASGGIAAAIDRTGGAYQFRGVSLAHNKQPGDYQSDPRENFFFDRRPELINAAKGRIASLTQKDLAALAFTVLTEAGPTDIGKLDVAGTMVLRSAMAGNAPISAIAKQPGQFEGVKSYSRSDLESEAKGRQLFNNYDQVLSLLRGSIGGGMSSGARLPGSISGRLDASGQNGADMPVGAGNEIRSYHNGVVSKLGTAGNNGNYAVINFIDDLGNRLEATYSHMAAMVREGQQVTGGQVIGRYDGSGRSSGPHNSIDINSPGTNGALQRNAETAAARRSADILVGGKVQGLVGSSVQSMGASQITSVRQPQFNETNIGPTPAAAPINKDRLAVLTSMTGNEKEAQKILEEQIRLKQKGVELGQIEAILQDNQLPQLQQQGSTLQGQLDARKKILDLSDNAASVADIEAEATARLGQIEKDRLNAIAKIQKQYNGDAESIKLVNKQADIAVGIAKKEEEQRKKNLELSNQLQGVERARTEIIRLQEEIAVGKAEAAALELGKLQASNVELLKASLLYKQASEDQRKILEGLTGQREQQSKINELQASYNSKLEDAQARVADIFAGLYGLTEYQKALREIATKGITNENGEADKILATAKAVDSLNQKARQLERVKDVAQAWTDSFIGFNAELLKTGNLTEALQNWADDVSSKAIDMLLEITMRPMQEQVFKAITDFLGFEKPADPMVKPLTAMDTNVQGIRADVQAIRERLQSVAQPTAANAIVPGPSSAAYQDSGSFGSQLLDKGDLLAGLYDSSAVALTGFQDTIVDVSNMFTNASGLGSKAFSNMADNIVKDDAKIKNAFDGRITAEEENIARLQEVGQKLGVGVQMLGSLAMGFAGFQTMKKGGAYNVLTGLAGIFGAVSGFSGGIDKMFGLQGFAEGGRPPLDRPSWIGEKGVPELWWPDTAGTIIPIDQLEGSDDDSYDGPAFNSGRGSSQQSGRFAATRAAMKQERDSRAISSNQDSRSSGQGGVIEVRSESTVINNVEYVTKEQHERGMRETAKAARSMTLQDMRNSVSTRKRLGMG